MSMGMVLEGVRDYLRTQHSWDKTNCGIQFGAVPIVTTSAFYVSLDDDGVTTTDPRNYHLTEEYAIEIGIWRRTGRLPEDYRGQLQLPDDIYIATAKTITDLERMVVGKLHKIEAARTSINTQFELPDATLGAAFNGHLTYVGRSKNETFAITGQRGTKTFAGRRLRLRGLRRIQRIDSMG